MIYLDYSATTPVNKEVLDSFNKVCLDYPGNANSLHNLGVEARKLEKEATKQLADLLGIEEKEIIYTSGASEANNTALKCLKSRGRHILTTNLEHSSIYGPLGYLQAHDYEVTFLETDESGLVDLDDLKAKLKDETCLVSVSMVNSETGLKQDIKAISDIVKKYPNCYLHVDITQAIGKIPLDLSYIDLASFSAHKFYGLKGIGALIKKNNVPLQPLIHGGKSTTVYRAGTPALPLIVSMSKALRLALDNLDDKYNKVLSLNNKIKEAFKDVEGLSINSNDNCIPHMLNISIDGVKPETMLHALEKYDIYISTQSACATGEVSKAVRTITHDDIKARSSLRISLSHLNTEEEIDFFIEKFKLEYESLKSLNK